MKFNKNNGEELNDGLLYFGTKKTLRDDKKKVIGNKFIANGELKYKIKSFKYDDFTSYFGIETRVDIKVKTYKNKFFEKTMLIQILDEYYDIVEIDFDKSGRYMFLYLQKRSGLND